MEIPISGFVFHAGEGDAEHSHKLFITSWNGRPVHVHNFGGATSYNDGHIHEYAGTTESAPTGVQHTHGYYTETTFNDGHTHFIRGVTGPSISVPGGGHIHYFQGATTINGRNPHSHFYEGQTSNEIG